MSELGPTPVTDRAHARLAPSASERWTACRSSAAYVEALMHTGALKARPSGPAAAFGTRCHTIAEELIKYHLIERRKGLDKNIAKLTADERRVVVPYLDYVANLIADAEVLHDDYEVRVEHKSVIDDPYCFGTSDLTFIGRSGKRKVDIFHSIDFKTGYETVDAEENTQLVLYAVGQPESRDANELRLTIVQPRASEGEFIKHWDLDAVEFSHHAQAARNAVAEAKYYLRQLDAVIAQKGSVSPPSYTVALKAGPHCKWCPAIALCPKSKEMALETARIDFLPVTKANETMKSAGVSLTFKTEELPKRLPQPGDMTPEQLGIVLDRMALLEAWVKAVEMHALERAQGGANIPGYKVVAKRSNRRYIEGLTPSKLAKALSLQTEQVTETEMLSPAQVEAELRKMFGKDKDRLARALARLESHVEKPDAGVTLAKESDRRPAVVKAALDFQPVPTGTNKGSANDEDQAERRSKRPRR